MIELKEVKILHPRNEIQVFRKKDPKVKHIKKWEDAVEIARTDSKFRYPLHRVHRMTVED